MRRVKRHVIVSVSTIDPRIVYGIFFPFFARRDALFTRPVSTRSLVSKEQYTMLDLAYRSTRENTENGRFNIDVNVGNLGFPR